MLRLIEECGTMILSQIASTQVITLTTAEPIARAMVVMQERGIRHLLILRAREPVGMVSDHDALSHVGWLHKGRHGREISASERVEKIMVTPLSALSPDDSVERAARLMLNKRIGAIPLVVGGRLAGIVTETDLLRCFTEWNDVVPDSWRRGPITEFMSDELVSVAPHEETLTAVRLMRLHQVNHLTVVDDGRLVGMISNRDILRGTPEGGSPRAGARNLPAAAALHVAGVMSSEVPTLRPHATLGDAAERMAEERVWALPIVVNQQLVGIINESDMLRALLAAAQEQSESRVK